MVAYWQLGCSTAASGLKLRACCSRKGARAVLVWPPAAARVLFPLPFVRYEKEVRLIYIREWKDLGWEITCGCLPYRMLQSLPDLWPPRPGCVRALHGLPLCLDLVSQSCFGTRD